MKKFLLTLVFLCTLCCNTYSQSLLYYNNTVEVGVHFGYETRTSNYWGYNINSPVITASIAAYGIYIDFGGWGPSHRNDYRFDDWDDESILFGHIGYQIPLSRFIKITPMIGYYNHKIGWTDGYDWYYDYDGYKTNRFVTEYEWDSFDVGGQVQLSIPCSDIVNFNVMGTITNNLWYGGIGFSVCL